MTHYEPDVLDSGKYGITKAAKLLGVSPKTFRKYVNAGQIKYGISRLNGRKFFYGAELKRAWRATL